MKKALFVLCVMMTAISVTVSAVEIPLAFSIIIGGPGDNHGDIGGNPHPRTPIQSPSVSIDGYTLYLYSGCEGCTIQLIDENENFVYVDSIGESQTSLVLPSTLSGTYELQIIQGNITFYCHIEL